MSGVHSCRATISCSVFSCQSSMVCPSALSVGVAGSQRTRILKPWWSLGVRYLWGNSHAPHIHVKGPAATPNSKGSCARSPMVNSGYSAAPSSLVYSLGLSQGGGLGFAAAFSFYEPRRRRASGRPFWGANPWVCWMGTWPVPNTGCYRVAGLSGFHVGTASVSWTACSVVWLSVPSDVCMTSGGSVGQVSSHCPACTPCRRMWLARRVACRVHAGVHSGGRGLSGAASAQ